MFDSVVEDSLFIVEKTQGQNPNHRWDIHRKLSYDIAISRTLFNLVNLHNFFRRMSHEQQLIELSDTLPIIDIIFNIFKHHKALSITDFGVLLAVIVK